MNTLLMSIVPIALLLLGLLGIVLSLDCIWRTKGWLRKASWLLLGISALYVVIAATEFFIVKINTLFVVVICGLLLLAISSVILTIFLYALIRSVEHGGE